MNKQELSFPAELRVLHHEALEYALSLGLLMRGADGRLGSAPFTLRPSGFSRDAFQQAVVLSDDFNHLLTAMAADHDFLVGVTAPTAAADSFVGRLYETYLQARRQGGGQELSLGLFRSDYLLQSDDRRSLRQVEINTIASAFGALGSRVSRLHQYLASRHAMDTPADLPDNDAEQGLVDAMATAWRHFGRDRAVVLFVVQPGERNVFDQRYLEYGLWQGHGIRVLRRSLEQIAEKAELNRQGDLMLEGETIALVYFRAGYVPDDYPAETQWQAREILERSSAVKCPSLAWQLCGSKKMQQILTEPGVLENLLADKARIGRIRACFAGLWSLDSTQIIEAALDDPGEYVLKPQREGGGHNLYGQDLVRTLKTMPAEERDGWIFMERIHPPASENCLLREGKTPQLTQVVSELGIYASCLSRGSELLASQHLGHLLRSKPWEAKEGGVAAGVAVLDSPWLSGL